MINPTTEIVVEPPTPAAPSVPAKGRVADANGTVEVPDAAILAVRLRFTVDDYYRLGDIGVIGPDERTELLDGEVVYKIPINSRHSGCVVRLNRIFNRSMGDRALVSIQDPVRLNRFSEPEPDVAILNLRPDSYGDAHPEPADVVLLVEVADSSLDLDRRVKIPLYAAAGIAEVWLVDLVHGSIETYRLPDARGYRVVERHGRGATLAVASFPDVSVTVDEVLGAAVEEE